MFLSDVTSAVFVTSSTIGALTGNCKHKIVGIVVSANTAQAELYN